MSPKKDKKPSKNMLMSGGYQKLPGNSFENAEVGRPQQVFEYQEFLKGHFEKQIEKLPKGTSLYVQHEIGLSYQEKNYEHAVPVACQVLAGNTSVASVKFEVHSYGDILAIADLIKKNKTITNIELSTGIKAGPEQEKEAEGWKKVINAALKARSATAPKITVNVDDIGVVKRPDAAP